jgi:hypothetical protein
MADDRGSDKARASGHHDDVVAHVNSSEV